MASIGFEIILSSLFFFGGIGLMIFGWAGLADKGAERFFNRQKGGVVLMIAGLTQTYLGALIATLSLAYWLVRDRLDWWEVWNYAARIWWATL